MLDAAAIPHRLILLALVFVAFVRTGTVDDEPRAPLPSSGNEEITRDPNPLVIVVPAVGEVVIAGRRVNDDMIDKLFMIAYQRDHDTLVLLEAGAGTHDRVVDLIERARSVGLRRFPIVASPEAIAGGGGTRDR